MKILAWLLGVIAIVGSSALAWNWIRAHREVKVATAAVVKARGDVADWEFSDELKHHNLEMETDNDRTELRTADLKVEIAEMEGHGLKQAQEERNMARTILRNSEVMLNLDRELQIFGPSSQVTDAVERQRTAEQSLAVWSLIPPRDEKFAYALGVVWLAFGFACALGFQRKLSN